MNLVAIKSLSEHRCTRLKKEKVHSKRPRFIRRRNGEDEQCYRISELDDWVELTSGYFVGLDWLLPGKYALQVQPKIDSHSNSTDILGMLFEALKIPEAAKELPYLYQIHWNDPWIPIKQNQDILTPFLMMEFLQLVKTIVRKGLRKSYYKVEHNLSNRVKGKVLVSKTIKHNILKNKQLQTYCSFEEFGINNKENRLLKKALVFVQRYLPNLSHNGSNSFLDQTLGYIRPAFEEVSDDISIQEVRSYHKNPFYKEYERALQLAKMILRRFGYNLQRTADEKIETPPFWIDMPILFELYVLKILKETYGSKVQYHFITHGNELDFLLNDDQFKMVVDAKYIPKWNDQVNHENVRQVSGYARLDKVYKELGIDRTKLIDALIIYPSASGHSNLNNVNFKEKSSSDKEIYKVAGYSKIYKVGIALPIVE